MTFVLKTVKLSFRIGVYMCERPGLTNEGAAKPVAEVAVYDSLDAALAGDMVNQGCPNGQTEIIVGEEVGVVSQSVPDCVPKP